MGKKDQIRLHKIPLGIFLDALLELYREGLDYIDIVGTPNENQDTIGIMFSKDYMSPHMRKMNEEIHEEDSISKEIDLSDDDDLNQII